MHATTRIALLGSLIALGVILLGAYVRLSDAGLGCPDWPGCYGRIIPPTDAGAIASANEAWPSRPVEVAKAWKEQVHRYLASVLGLLIVVLTLRVWTMPVERRPPRALAGALLVLVVFQGILGMWTVTLLLKPLVVTAHLLGGLTTLALLWWLHLGEARPETVPPGAGPRLEPRLVLLALGALYLQIALGGWTSTNYAAWACGPDFPRCLGQWLPTTDFPTAFTLWHGLGIDYEHGILDTPARTAIHLTHRVGAVLAATVILGVALRARASGVASLRRSGLYVILALALQLLLGVGNVKLGLPLPVAVGHAGGAALLLIALVALLHAASRLPPPSMDPRR